MVEERVAVAKRTMSRRERILRRERIFARLREGWAYGDIASAEGLTARRIRQIVSETLQRRAVDKRPEHAMLQLARLQPALRLAAGALAKGKIGAIAPYLKLLDRLDLYQKSAAAAPAYDEAARERLLAKINRIAARVTRTARPSAARGAAALAEDGGEGRAADAGGESAATRKKQFGFGRKGLKSLDSRKTIAWIPLPLALLRLPRALEPFPRAWIPGSIRRRRSGPRTEKDGPALTASRPVF